MILGRGFRRQRRIGRRLGSGCWRLSVNYALSVARKGKGGGLGVWGGGNILGCYAGLILVQWG